MNALKRARLLAELRQVDVQIKTGIRSNRLWLLEHGLDRPKLGEVERLAKVYGCRPEDLVEQSPGADSANGGA